MPDRRRSYLARAGFRVLLAARSLSARLIAATGIGASTLACGVLPDGPANRSARAAEQAPSSEKPSEPETDRTTTDAKQPSTTAETNGSSPETLYGVETQTGVAYYDGADASKTKHTLDLYLPRDGKDFPTVLFIHGGAWIFGDKADFGVYAALGRMLAERGIGCAVANYRLSPGVKHPEHIKDVARAFAWLNRNVAKYGGRADALYVSGHSAGGHLAALLATDASYLEAEGLKLTDVKGVAPMSGVYRIPPLLFRMVFGGDDAVRRKAAPINHVSAAAPPFLIIYAERDFPYAERMATELAKSLVNAGAIAATLAVEERNHVDILLKASRPDDPVGKALVEFVRHTPAK